MRRAKTAMTIFGLINTALSCFFLFRTLELRVQQRHAYSLLLGKIRDRLQAGKMKEPPVAGEVETSDC